MPELVVELPDLVSAVDDLTQTGDGWSVEEPTAVDIRKAVRDGLAGSSLRLSRTEIAKVSAAAVQRSKECSGPTPDLL